MLNGVTKKCLDNGSHCLLQFAPSFQTQEIDVFLLPRDCTSYFGGLKVHELSARSLPAFSTILPSPFQPTPSWKPWRSIARSHGKAGLACAAAALVFLCLLPDAGAQITQLTDMTTPPAQGVGHNLINLLAETVNPATGQVSVHIDIPMPPGRGFTLPFSINYNSGSVNQLAPNMQTGQNSGMTMAAMRRREGGAIRFPWPAPRTFPTRSIAAE